MKHLLHQTLQSGTILELAPEKIEIGEVEAETPTYCFQFEADGVTVRATISAGDFRQLIENAAKALDGKPTGAKVKKSKLEIARTLPAPFAGGRRMQ